MEKPATARHHANPINWNGDLELQLAKQALHSDNRATVTEADRDAVTIVR